MQEVAFKLCSQIAALAIEPMMQLFSTKNGKNLQQSDPLPLNLAVQLLFAVCRTNFVLPAIGQLSSDTIPQIISEDQADKSQFAPCKLLILIAFVTLSAQCRGGNETSSALPAPYG